MPTTTHFKSVAIYDWPAKIEGDSILGKSMNLEYKEGGQVKDLTGATVTMDILRGQSERIYKTLSSENANEIQIVTPSIGLIQIQNINTDGLSDGDYLYRLRVVYSDGLKITFAVGRFPVWRTKKMSENLPR